MAIAQKRLEQLDIPSLLAHIGDTPLIPLKSPNARAQIFGKAEWFNPGGSVKDRAAKFIFERAIASGQLTREKILLDATSGNTGIAYAMIGAALGYRVALVMPANVSVERKKIARAYGAELIESDPLEGSDGAIVRARELARDAQKYFYADQYNNSANVHAHYTTTAPEIWEQTRGMITHFVAGVGTSGTMMGAGARLKEFNPAIQLIEVQPADELQIIEGLKHMESAIVPGIYDAQLADKQIAIETDAAYREAHRVAREEGLFVGLSAGAAIAAARQIAQEIETGIIIAILPDSGDRYLSTALWM
ncbi:MAG: pyridoxal-phosphate dependent enzyme [Chloroflexi bacterium]|nr:pyridoxal-phosphate dependent enzyme [Chloroflexota bacterium]